LQVKGIRFFAGALMALAAMAAVPPARGETADLGAIRAQQAEIREDARAGRGIYANLSETQRTELFSRQDATLRLIEGKQTPDELSEPERVKLFNQLEAIEALVNEAEDQRMICERVSTIGTNRKQRVCKTVAQRRQEMQMAQDMLNRGANCVGATCTGN
jgi:hypothetical protein